MPGTNEARLAALGRILDRRGIRDAFLRCDQAGVTVTVVDGVLPVGSRYLRRGRLDLLARWASRRGPDTPASAAHSPREAVLRLAGRALDQEQCRAAFIVVYDDLLLIDDERLAVTPAAVRTPIAAPVGG